VSGSITEAAFLAQFTDVNYVLKASVTSIYLHAGVFDHNPDNQNIMIAIVQQSNNQIQLNRLTFGSSLKIKVNDAQIKNYKFRILGYE
jgi:hypothetical protein